MIKEIETIPTVSDKKQMCDKIQDSLKEAVTYDGYFCVDISNEQKNKIRWLFKN